MTRKKTRDSEPLKSAKKTAPAFQLYAGDWLASTLGMPWDVKGIYIDFLCWSWENGPIPDDPAWRLRMIGGTPQSVQRYWTLLKPRWKRLKNGWINRRLERQREIQKTFAERGKMGARARWPSAQASIKHGLKHGVKHRSSIAQAHAKPMLERWPSSSSSSSVDQDQPAASPPVNQPPFKRYSAIAKRALMTEPLTTDLGELAERFKQFCAAQQLPYGPEITQKAIDSVIRARARRRA